MIKIINLLLKIFNATGSYYLKALAYICRFSIYVWPIIVLTAYILIAVLTMLNDLHDINFFKDFFLDFAINFLHPVTAIAILVFPVMLITVFLLVPFFYLALIIQDIPHFVPIALIAIILYVARKLIIKGFKKM